MTDFWVVLGSDIAYWVSNYDSTASDYDSRLWELEVIMDTDVYFDRVWVINRAMRIFCFYLLIQIEEFRGRNSLKRGRIVTSPTLEDLILISKCEKRH